MKVFRILPLLMIALFAQAQTTKAPVIRPYSPDEEKIAKKDCEAMIKAGVFNPALPIAQRLHATRSSDAQYNYLLGIAYLNSNVNKAKAVEYLEFADNANTKEKPKDLKFDLAFAYHHAAMYDKAKETYEAYRTEKKGTVDTRLRYDLHYDWAENAGKYTSESVPAQFENLGKGVNSAWADFQPVISASDSLVYFSSLRKGNTGGMTDDLGDIPADIYYFAQNDTMRGKAKNAGINLNTAFYDQAVWVNMSGNRMLIYRESDEVNNDLMQALLKGKQWDKTVALGKDFITKVVESGGCISPDGSTLYFAAEVEGSKTGKDIWFCTRNENSWSKPEKMGDEINTAYNEDAPQLWHDGKTLFFSSEGHGSIGGYDIFMSYRNDPKQKFSKPESIGYPLNTLYDDIGIALNPDGKTLYLAQVREGGFGNYDLYKVKLEKPLIKNPMVHVQGLAMTNLGTPAKDAIVVISDAASGETLLETETNEATGRFDAALPAGTYKVSVRHVKSGKAEAEITVDPNQSGRSPLLIQFP